MKKLLVTFAALTLILFCGITKAAALSAAGYWNTVDDKTGKILTIVQLYKDKDGTFSGKIVHIYKVKGQHPNDKCVACDGDLKNKPIMGLRIIYGMQKESATEWVGGRALDPTSGKVYRAKMTLIDNGCKLNLRGYIGLPLFGRTETWLRTKSKQCAANK